MRKCLIGAILAASLFVGCANQSTNSPIQPTTTAVPSPTTPTVDPEKQAVAVCKQAIVEKFKIWNVVFLDPARQTRQPEPNVLVIRSTVLAMRRMNAHIILADTWTWMCVATNEAGQWKVDSVLTENFRK